MSATGLDVFDKSLQTTNIWLDEIMSAVGPDRQLAWHVLGAVLHTIRDRVPAELAFHLGAQLPLIIRGAYYDQWQLRREPERYRSLDEFLDRIGFALRGARPVNRLKAVQAVFSVLSRHVTLGQIEKVREALPDDVRSLWSVGMTPAA
jgi:uncharacterized protein (DUF2267 family)